MLCTFTAFANAAEMEFSPDKVYELNANSSSFNYPSILIDYKPEAESYVLAWELLEEDMNQFWDYSLCDYNTCYFDIPEGSTMEELKTGDIPAFFKLNLIPGGFTGTGTIKLRVYDRDKPSVSDTVTFKVNITDMVGTDVTIREGVNFFPNPVKEKLNVESVSPITSFKILTISGAEIISKDNLNDYELNVNLSDLDNGVYIFSYISGGDKYFEKIIISK